MWLAAARLHYSKTHHVFPLYIELYSYLRSPYRDLSAYDNNVQVGLLRTSILVLVPFIENLL